MTLLQILNSQKCSLVLSRGAEIAIYNGRGLRPLLQLQDNDPEKLNGASLADKAVGKAAAAIMVLGGVKAVSTSLISEPALQLLTANNIAVSYSTLVPAILNRDRSALCPMEQATLQAATPKAALAAVREKIAEMRAGKG